MWVIQKATQQPLSFADTNGLGDLMFFIPWDGMPLGYLQSNMRFKLVPIPRSQPEPTSKTSLAKSKHSALVTTGIAKSILPTQTTIAGLSGSSPNSIRKGLAYLAEVPVNWCPALGTVLANEEVIDGKSERGGHPVIRKPP